MKHHTLVGLMDISMAFCVMLADVAVRLIYYGNSIIHSPSCVECGSMARENWREKACRKNNTTHTTRR